MKTLKYILFIGMIIGLLNFQKAEEKINNIEFSYYNARRIPFHEVKIKINRARKNDNAKVTVRCKPLTDDAKWNSSKIDTTYNIDIETFEKLANSMQNLDKIDLDKAYSEGLDGYTCKIEYGGKGKNKSYSFWVPGSRTEKRGLTEFMNLCKQILEIGNLKKEDIFED